MFTWSKVRMSRQRVIEKYDLHILDEYEINSKFLKYNSQTGKFVYAYKSTDMWEHYEDKTGKSFYKIKSRKNGEYPPHEYVVQFKKIDFLVPEYPIHAILLAGIHRQRKFNDILLINTESTINEMTESNIQYKIHGHLGLLYIGTIADQEGLRVTLHDELVQGYIDLEQHVTPGSIVGFSLVATGFERGVELARQAKKLGATYVICGNDAAAFRAQQLMQLPDKPFDAVFTSNSLTTFRQFLQQIEHTEPAYMNIDGMVTQPIPENISNEQSHLKQLVQQRITARQNNNFDVQDVFCIPKFDLYEQTYWEQVWSNYRKVFGHKHKHQEQLRNALIKFAQGCTRTKMTDVCSYCTINGVGDIRVATQDHLRKLYQAYQDFGINYVYNVTDSSYEMRGLLNTLRQQGIYFDEGMMIYGRAWGLANHPRNIDDWLTLTGGRLIINAGFDSGDERILSTGVVKASMKGSRLTENQQAIRNVKNSGAHLHYSLIFGSPGESFDSCKRTLEFFEWSRQKLGKQLDQCETDLYWLNHGSPASRVFHDYTYAQHLASLAGKEISLSDWREDFQQHKDTLIVPWSCEEAWYKHFTTIPLEYAQECMNHVHQAMASHDDAAPGRPGAFKTV